MTALLSLGAGAQSLWTKTLWTGTQTVTSSAPLTIEKSKLQGARVGSQICIYLSLSGDKDGYNIIYYHNDDQWKMTWSNKGNNLVVSAYIDNDILSNGLTICAQDNDSSTPTCTVTMVTLNYNGANFLTNAEGWDPNWYGTQLNCSYASEGDILAVSVKSVDADWKALYLQSGYGNTNATKDTEIYNSNGALTDNGVTLEVSYFTGTNEIVVGDIISFTGTEQTGEDKHIYVYSNGSKLTENWWYTVDLTITSDNIETIKNHGVVVKGNAGTLSSVKKKSAKADRPTSYYNTSELTAGETLYITLTSDLVDYAKAGNLYLAGWEYTASSVDLIYKSAVNIADMSNGTVVADKTKAAYGETVTLTVTPDGNYALGTLTVTDATGAAVSTSGSGNTYSFTMPATAVTVNATFTHNDNLTLSTDKILCFNSTGGRVTDQRYYTDSHTLWVGEGEHNGWDLTIGRTATTEEFTGVTINFSDKQNIKLEIAYNDGSDKTYTKDLSSETSSVSINFSTAGITGVLKSIMFKRVSSGNSKIVFTGENSVTMQIASEATYSTPRSSMTLTYETLEDSGGSSVEYDNTDNKQQFEIKSGTGHWAFWDFTLPIPTSLYNGINFNLTQAPAGSKIEIIYDGNGDNPQQVNIESAVSSETNFNVNFNRTGNITRIRFAGAGTYKMGTCTAKPAKYQVTVSTAKYATFGDLGSPDVIDYGSASGLKAYIAYVNGDKVKLEEVSKRAANTAVILYADVEEATSYTVSTTDESADTPEHANQLQISDGTVTGNGSTIYVLANGNNGVGFYLVKNGSAITAGKAYLSVSAGARQFIGFGEDNETTGIQTVANSQQSAANSYYDLQGRRVAQPTKGLYVVNGKKVVIK